MNLDFKYSISVIIVNYNVEFFLEQCLNSVKTALKKIDGEVFIVDNDSIDKSVEMVQEKFPEFHLILSQSGFFSDCTNLFYDMHNNLIFLFDIYIMKLFYHKLRLKIKESEYLELLD